MSAKFNDSTSSSLKELLDHLVQEQPLDFASQADFDKVHIIKTLMMA